jgi:response regulator RpfG family c-di-GMP phosphodiesterase/pSer/pThr/pTyr-binding forkhead associated (FHA) protein
MAILRVKSGPYKGKVFEIRDESLAIGRDVSDGAQILDQGVSRRHAEVFRIGEMFFIRDLESRNGTFVNDKQISEELLRVGDQIRIGNSVLVFEDKLSYLKDSRHILSDPEQQEGAQPAPSSTIRLHVTAISPGAKRVEPEPQASPESRNLSVLFQLGCIINEEKDLSRLLGRAAELVGKSLDADHIYILWSKEAEDAYEILGRFDKDVDDGGAGCVSRAIIRDCLRQGRAILTADASTDKQFNTMATVVMRQLRSVMCVPISLLGKSHGVLYIYSKKSEAFATDDLEMVSAVGIQLGTIIGLLRMLRRADKFFRNSIRTIVKAIEMRSPETRGQSERVASYCISIAKELGLETNEVRNAWLAGMLHDIGSIPLTDKERAQPLTLETKKNHYARELFKQAPEIEAVLPAIEAQNERWDGSGSPEGKKAEDIPVLARILGLALELDRNLYHGASGSEEMTIKDALLKVRDLADKQFNKETINALLRAYRSGKLFDQEEEFFEADLG